MKRNSFSRFLMGKGLYVALAVCLAGAGTAAWVTVNNRISEPTPFAETPPAEVQPQENINPSLSAEEPHINTEETAPVEQKQPQVSKEESKPIEESSSSSSSVSLPEDTSASVSTSEPLQASDESQTISFTMPLNSAILAPFSGDKLVENRTLKEWRTHNGIDLQAQNGDMVKAACDGKVTAITFDPLWGTTVEVQSNEHTLTYCGLSEELNIKLNDHIKLGDNIGTIGEIPCEAAEGLHLHFTVQHNNEYIDPFSLLSE